uniref:Uncharacterized protein n=1 Tax=Chrysotila carterae TaxID=13221 RepID=A0A7S4EST3_CHRCT
MPLKRVALVTGASKGIGLGIARAFGEKGYRVHISASGRTPSGPGSLEAAKEAIESVGGECVPHVCDHSKEEAIGALFDEILAAEPDGIDVLVNNVYGGVDFIAKSMKSGSTFKFWEHPPSVFSQINQIGLTAHYVASVHYAKAMVPRKRGLIVQVSSAGGLLYIFNSPYSTGKAALDRLSRDLAFELEGTGVGCVTIYPGMVATEKFQALASDKAAPWLSEDSLASKGETPLFVGRGTAALVQACADDPKYQSKVSGTIQWIAEIAARHKIRDERGNCPPSFRAFRGIFGFSWIPLTWVVPWWIIKLMTPLYMKQKPAPPADGDDKKSA